MNYLLQIGEAKLWADFGLAGLMLFSLFTGMASLIAWLVKHISTVITSHTSERREWRDTAKAEREEITKNHREDRKETMEVSKNLTVVVADLRDVLLEIKAKNNPPTGGNRKP